MDYPEVENIEKHLRKKYKDWSDEKIEAEARRIWQKYVEDNHERLEISRMKDKEKFNESLDREFRNLLMDSYDDDL